MTLLKLLRQSGERVPTIILAANASLGGCVAGLDSGAGDCLAKQFEIAEAEARIRAKVRRRQDRAAPEIIVGDLVFTGATRQFLINGEPLVPTPREHAVLEHLITRIRTTVSKASLSESVFGFDDEVDPSAIEIYFHRLRKKLEGSSRQIVTLRERGQHRVVRRKRRDARSGLRSHSRRDVFRR